MSEEERNLIRELKARLSTKAPKPIAREKQERAQVDAPRLATLAPITAEKKIIRTSKGLQELESRLERQINRPQTSKLFGNLAYTESLKNRIAIEKANIDRNISKHADVVQRKQQSKLSREAGTKKRGMSKVTTSLRDAMIQADMPTMMIVLESYEN
jgi:hypothetical protein